MFGFLLLAAVLSGLAYLAAYKLRRTRRVLIAAGTFALLGILPIAFVILNDDLLACWAYYDQCAAQRISGLSEQDCLKRDDAVAFLHEGGVCLVETNE